MSFIDVFGGENRSPAQLDLSIISITANTTLVWTWQTGVAGTKAAHKMDVTATAGLSITLPSAELASVGEDITFINAGANTFTVLDAAGGAVGSVASGEVWLFYVRENDDAAGSWGSWQMGIGTSQATAASLAGSGLLASASNTLNQMAPTVETAANRDLTSADRAKAIVSTGGAITFAFDPVADLNTVGQGWFVFVRNEGSGELTLLPDGAETIDGAASKVLQPDESCIVIATSSDLLTYGYGRPNLFTVGAEEIDIAGSGGFTWTEVQRLAQVQNYVGALTGNRTIDIGSDPGYWFVWNNTSGAYTVKFRVDSGDPGVFVTQGTLSVIRSDGALAQIAFTDTVSSISQVAGETVCTPNPIVLSGTIGLANTAVVAGSYGAPGIPTITVDAKGRLTAAANDTTPDLGTPSAGVLTSCTGLPISTGVAGLGTGVATFLGTPSSANLLSALTTKTGTGLAVFDTSPTIATATLTTPTITTPSISDANLTGTPTAPTAAASTDTTQVATTAYVKDQYTDGTGGTPTHAYTTLFGLRIEFGVSSSIASLASEVQTFQGTFSTTPRVLATPRFGGGAVTGQWYISATSTTSMTIQNDTSAAGEFFWMAIGFA